MISLLEPHIPKLNEKSINNSTDSKRFLSQQKLNECVISKDDTTNELIKRNLEIIGKIDSKFYLIKKLGKGSYSKVYLGVSIEQLETKNTKDEIKFYSIKVINPIKSDISMFKNEVEFLENIDHDNILKIYAYGAGIKSKIKDEKIKEKKIFYIVMEYIDHGELLNYITKVSPFESKGFGEDLGKLIFSQLLDGLEEIHSKNIFHRDIKLENIMLGKTGSLPFKLATPNDMFYQFIIKSDYVGFWKKRMSNVSPDFMELFDNMIAFDYTQRPSISEIRQSPWMKNINYDLLPLLKKELNAREEIMKKMKNEELIKEKQIKENTKKLSLLELKPIRKNFDIINNNSNDSNTIKLNEEKKNNSNEIKIINENMNISSNSNKGSIRIKFESNNLNIALTKLKKYFKYKGYSQVNINVNRFCLRISKNEIDIILKLEKNNNIYTKLNYYKIKGTKVKFDDFKRHVFLLKDKSL